MLLSQVVPALAQTSDLNAAYINNAMNSVNAGMAGAQGALSSVNPGPVGISGSDTSATVPTKSTSQSNATSSPHDANEPLQSPRLRIQRPPQPSQFQRFVQESTGRLLPVFGSELFDNPQGYTPDNTLPAPYEYILGAGDEVRIQVWGAVDYSGTHTLDRNGQISLPKVGTFSLAGVAVRDLEGVLRSHLAKVFTNFNVNANLGRLRSIQVYVVGQARQPGTYKLSSLGTMVNALFASGGPNANGSMRNIQLTRAGKVVTTLDLYDFIARGDKGRDLPLQSGDVIVIPPVGARIAVTGALDQAAIYELRAGSTTVGDVLGLSGGVPALAKAQKALLERIDTDRTPARQVQEIALNAAGLKLPMRDGDVLTILPISQAFANAVTLQGTVAEPLRYGWFEGMRIRDLIPEREALITPDYYKRKNLLVQNTAQQDEFSSGYRRNAGAARDSANFNRDGTNVYGENGAGRDSGGYPRDQTNARDAAVYGDVANARDTGGTREGSASRDTRDVNGYKESGSRIINRVRNNIEQINWEYAVIERMDPARLTTTLIPFNLGKAVLEKDSSNNMPLLPGDVVTIMSQNDLRLPQERQSRLVRVEGEVAAPGVYQVQAGETLPQLLRRLGGLTAQAYVFGTEFNRESVRQRQQENLDSLIRRLEAQAQSQASSIASNSRTENQAQAQAILLQQQAQLKSQIERLRSMRSNGRMALELDPTGKALAALPDIPLEDGDRVLVPSTPSFVAAFGSVNNENVFLFKPGKTVSDVIKSAGLTDEADLSQVFVLRADGSIVSRRDRAGLFGGSFDSLALMPGDTVVVPAQVDRENTYNFTVRALKDWTQILANFGLGIVAFKNL